MATDPFKNSNRMYTKETLRFYWQATLHHKKLVLLGIMLPISTIALSVAVPFLASKIIASLVQGGEYRVYIWWFAAAIILGIIGNKIGIRALMRLTARALYDLHMLAFSSLQKRSASFYANRVGGKLVSDMLDFVSSYAGLLTAGFIKGFGFLCTVIIGFIILFIASWQLGLFASIFLIGVSIWTILESKKRSNLRLERLRSKKQVASHLSDNLVNAVTVKMFAREDDELKLTAKYSKELQRLQEKDWVRATGSENNRVGVILLMQLGLVLLLVHLVQQDPSVLAAGIFAFTYTLTVSNRFFELNTIIRQVEESFLNASPMTEILLEAPEISDALDANELIVTQGEITMQNVGFYYADNTRKDSVFKDLNLTIAPGEKIGLIGHSGGGKSTLTRMLMRFDDVTSGVITIDGQDIRSVTQASLRRHIAYVPQEPLLFHRSIKENIIYGKPSASDAEIFHAAKLAFADEFITSLPQGYDTMVGERGVKLSGGQRQRIAIARAILKDAPILILDEATSALDSESEVYIQKALLELMKERTTIVIAHRLSTIQKMDRIIVLDEGKITEEGSHKELLSKNGIYARLWAHQSGGFIEE